MNYDFVRVANESDLVVGAGRVLRIRGLIIALFRAPGAIYAVENSCPHQSGPLGEGSLTDTVVTCPRHGWQFDVQTGACLDLPTRSVATFPVRLEGDEVWVGLPASVENASPTPNRFLIRYGPMGIVEHFQSRTPMALARGTRVVVQSDRGLELGEVLLATDELEGIEDNALHDRWVIRAVTEEDVQRERTLQASAQEAFEKCRQVIADRRVPVEVVDAERLFDGNTIVLYLLGDSSPALAGVAAELTARYKAEVMFRPLGERFLDPAASHCGQGEGHGCGDCQGGGACGRGTHGHEEH